MVQLRKPLTLVAILMIAGFLALQVSAQMPPKNNVLRETDESNIDEKGDAKFTGVIVFPSESVYSTIKSNFPNPNVLVRDLLGSTGKVVLKDSNVTYDDGRRAVQVTTTMLGAATNQRNKWKVDVGKGTELLHVDGRFAVVMNVATKSGMVLVESGKIQLPTSAKHVKVDRESGFLTYDFDREPTKGDVGIDVDMKVKARLMPALAKIYGSSEFNNGTFWTAKTLFTNTGSADITHLKISYRLGDYSVWSPNTEYSLVAPGGHVVDLYFPLLSKDVADLKSRTPVDLEVKYTYTDAAGKEYSDTSSKRITILGANGFEYSNLPDEERTSAWSDDFSNSPLIAAFVTKMDDPVRAFGGLVAQVSGGQPGGISDEGTIKFCRALYDLEVANHMSYQGSTSLTTENGGVAQELKYPRDVLRDKSGTCIELAILYAATCETAGVRCQLMMIPGHCFPVVTLPSGNLLPVESTCISGAAIPTDPKHPHPQPYSFEDAHNFAVQEYSEHISKPGLFYLVDVRDMWNQGVLVPELSKVPTDVLATWGWKATNPADPAPRPKNGEVVVQNGPDAKHPGQLVGTWNANLNFGNGNLLNIQLTLNADGTFSSTSISAVETISNEGNWELNDKLTSIVTTNQATGKVISRPFGSRGDVLDVTDPNMGNIRFQRNKQR